MAEGKPAPVVFIASSGEALRVAQALEKGLETRNMQPRIWSEEFMAGKLNLEVLREQVEEVDFAVVLFTPDDTVESRGKEQASPRDNVLFELGLFMGRLGRRRAFLVQDRAARLKIPSDLAGLVPVEYEGSAGDGIDDSILEACDRILEAAEAAPNRMSPTVSALSFEKMIGVYQEMLDALEADDKAVWQEIEEDGDGARVLRGLRDGLLFIARGAVTGHVDSVFYGNLMEYEKEQDRIAHAHSCGPYNDETITRRWSTVSKRGQGVGAQAFVDGEIQVRNDMASESSAPPEERLRAMMAVPIEPLETCPAGAIAVLNIDAARADAFPSKDSAEFAAMKAERLDPLVALLRRTNRLSDAS